ncbi:hypothetical protein EMWEY_00021910, partial [Eimeria maxima]
VCAPLTADAEACCWNLSNLASCFVSAEDGSMECIDFRRASTGPSSAAAAADPSGAAAAAAAPRLWRIAAHTAAATALQQQQQLPGLLMSCGLDETARGPLFSCRGSEEKGIFGFGGSQVVIWDIGDTEHIAKAFNL